MAAYCSAHRQRIAPLILNLLKGEYAATERNPLPAVIPVPFAGYVVIRQQAQDR